MNNDSKFEQWIFGARVHLKVLTLISLNIPEHETVLHVSISLYVSDVMYAYDSNSFSVDDLAVLYCLPKCMLFTNKCLICDTLNVVPTSIFHLDTVFLSVGIIWFTNVPVFVCQCGSIRPYKRIFYSYIIEPKPHGDTD